MAKFQYRVKVGSHVDEKGKLYNAGDIIKTDIPLHEKFAKGKFEQLKKPLRGDESESETSETELDDNGLGEEVTEQFPDANDVGLRIFKKGKKYSASLDGETAYNEESMTNKSQVNDFILSCYEDNDDDSETES